ncbi:MAG: penicillin acylase family protein, partial [Chloroflexota bacterium]|nr:penicillin acylase family protein [Chloroflexota bacterium]
MLRTISRILIGLIGILLLAAVALAVFGFFTVRRSFPQINGEIQVNGPDSTIDIYRDSSGIPHIYADTQHDLFYAQGYIHAQDRFWQMDFWRHLSSARLSEMFGDSQLETDMFLRTLGWARVAEQELQMLDEDSLAILEAYTDGVNAYLADHDGSELSLEYAVLKLQNAGYQVEPWQPLHTQTWAKVLAWDLGGNMDSEIERAKLMNMFPPELVVDLTPPYPDDAPIIVPVPNTSAGPPTEATVDLSYLQDQGVLAALDVILSQIESLEGMLGERGPGIGSNSWTLSGELTDTHMPLLANDPHLSAQMPSIWYEVGLHCTRKGPDCPYDVAGFSFTGTPGVVIGHNDSIAWGFTNVGPDVQDLYIEKINPQNPNQYEVNGEWVDMTLVEEVIQVAGAESVPITVRYTRHGPIVSDTYGDLEDFDLNAGIELPEYYAISLRWTALEPGTIFKAIWQFNAAQNWQEFREGAAMFSVPSQNLVYADVDGNIGYQ